MGQKWVGGGVGNYLVLVYAYIYSSSIGLDLFTTYTLTV